MPFLLVFHILVILKEIQTKNEIRATALDTLHDLHFKIKYMHAIGTLGHHSLNLLPPSFDIFSNRWTE